MPDLSLNVRYLLWKAGTARAEWGAKLAALLAWSEITAEAFLAGESGTLNDKERKVLARFGGLSEADLTSKDLLTTANLDLFHENLSFLIDLLPHGEKKRFAVKLGVDATTISRWKNGVQRPTKKKLTLILRYFGQSETVDLASDPIFLSATPVGSAEMRAWLHGRIDRLEVGDLRNLFPAFARLLKSP